MKRSLEKRISDIPPELILQTMSFMKSKDIKEYCKINPYINKICLENNNLMKYGLMNDLDIIKVPNYFPHDSLSSLFTGDSLSGGSPDAHLQRVLMKNIQKQYGIKLSPKVIKKNKKSKKRSRKRLSPLKMEITEIKSGGGETRSQYYGKRSKIMVKVPENVKNTALYSYKLKKLGFGGGLETGWKRAKQLSTKESIPIEDLRFMHAWFSRHIYASYPSYKKWKDAGRPKTKEWHRKHGIISWLIWGGSPALNWVNSKVGLLNKSYPNKHFKKITVKK